MFLHVCASRCSGRAVESQRDSGYIVILNMVFSAARPCSHSAERSVSSLHSLARVCLQGTNCELNTLGSDDFPDGVRKQPTLQL